MKTIGLLGGMSWESTVTYYQELNRGVRARRGELHSAKCLMASVDFAEVAKMQERGAWSEAGAYLAGYARDLERGGAECVVLCTNTMHRVFDDLRDAVSIPVLHIADGTARALTNAGVRSVGLLGTRYTMEQEFYRSRLVEHGLTVVVPDERERGIVHDVIYHELCLGKVLDQSRAAYQEIVSSLARRGAEAVILGCTEIGLLLNADNSPLPVFDTTLLHVEAALDWALEES
ncbi:aspartate/glutamate racemase family protein [Umezawaea endophytica]|uniref:Aspartate/glutamate racemase family protein n=1 Tax=Umezawaea endophytica TaxID=1654476 RepID=A0A9X2VPG5_9PSEU|nr:aspartate/glutamate racemase family protein [Umezawaea endophytica]MCS7480415.1 aspartate/glutamate racemase family protein [Umezawaea endophytica]